MAVLDNCIDAVETELLNGVSTLSFTMPITDPKNKHCAPFSLVRWEEPGLPFGVGPYYRILDSATEEQGGTGTITYQCEHVIGSLIDDVLFGSFELLNRNTRYVLEWILARQTAGNWVLGDCEISRVFSYGWSNENLLVALHSVADPFDVDYRWEFDTSVYPYKMHLRALDQSVDPQYYIRDEKNLISASSESRGSQLCTRLYALGYGEGINQLNFSRINGGKAYIDAGAAAIAQYGIVSRILVDPRITEAAELLTRARALMRHYQEPYRTYQASVADLEKATKDPYDRAEAGKIVWYRGERTFVTKVERHLLAVGQDTVELANAPEDVASSIAALADRQRINSVYARGARTMYTLAFNDNADASYPAVFRFWIPPETKDVNRVVLIWSYEAFRAYSTGASTVAQTTPTTSSGGATTQSSNAGGGSSSSTSEQQQGTSTTTAGGSTTVSGGEITISAQSPENPTPRAVGNTGTDYVTGVDSPGLHRHTNFDYSIARHTHTLNTAHSHQIGAHSHNFTVPGHSHSFSVPAHTHSVTIPAHTHTVTIAAHTHTITYGIYTGPRATSATIRVDGVTVPVSGTEVEISSRLSVDNDGRIRRGTHHTIEIVPNGLTRISATLTVELFPQADVTSIPR